MFTEKFSRTTTIHPGIFRGRALWAHSVSPRMNTIASRDQFKPIKIGENLVVNYTSLSNTVEQIRPVNGLTRLVRSVQIVKQWFTSRTGRGTMVTGISLVRQHFNLDSTTRTTRTGRTGRDTMVYESYSW